MVNNIKNNTISEIDAKKDLKRLFKTKIAELKKYKIRTSGQKDLLNLFDVLLKTILINNDNDNDNVNENNNDNNDNNDSHNDDTGNDGNDNSDNDDSNNVVVIMMIAIMMLMMIMMIIMIMTIRMRMTIANTIW